MEFFFFSVRAILPNSYPLGSITFNSMACVSALLLMLWYILILRHLSPKSQLPRTMTNLTENSMWRLQRIMRKLLRSKLPWPKAGLPLHVCNEI